MTESPPRLAERFLAWCLGPDGAARSILGDLAEDYSGQVRRRGSAVAGLWYWKEALSLGASALVGRVAGRPLAHRRTKTETAHGEATMKDAVCTIGFVQDARYALRAVLKDLAFFTFATAIIGLGVGASTAVFSVMSPLLLQPLPFEEPDRLALVALSDEEGAGLSAVTSRTSNLRDFRELSRSFESLGGYNAFFEQGIYNLVGDGEPERLIGVDVTHDFLDVLGVEPIRGRNFAPEEGVADGRPAIILTHGYWERRFASDPSVVGTSLSINGVPTAVVGVLPPTSDFSSVFTPASRVDFLRPWPVSDETDSWGNTTTMVGRLAPGATVASAQAELESITASLQQAQPDRWGLEAAVSGLQEKISRPFRAGMFLLAVAAGGVMLIVCVNLSNMLLARSPRRRREMAVRRTMGATRGRLIRQLLFESTAVSLSGALVGVLLASAAIGFVTRTTGLEIPMLGSASIDARALLFTAGIALVAGLVVGIVPALQVAEGGEAEALSSGRRGSSGGRRGRRLREILVVAEVAAACVLLVFGGLVLKSFQQLMDVELGFESADALAVRLNPSRTIEDLPEIVAYYEGIVAAVESAPGVRAVGLTDALPLGRNRTWVTQVVGKNYDDQNPNEGIFPHIVDHRYTEAMGIDLVAGRTFDSGDTGDGAPVVLVNETAAEQMLDGRALGRSLQMWFGEAEVVGVVEDVKHEALDVSGTYEVYFSMAQVRSYNAMDMVVRSDVPLARLRTSVADAIHSVDAQVPVDEVWTLESRVAASVSPRRFTLQLLGAFAGSALLLAALGIYGVLSYSVTERIPEIGIRMALGESAAGVLRNVVGKTLILATIGVVAGTVTALLGTRLISSLLYGVEATDPVTFATMIALLMAVATGSGLVPAIRAARVDSAAALRSEA